MIKSRLDVDHQPLFLLLAYLSGVHEARSKQKFLATAKAVGGEYSRQGEKNSRKNAV